MKVSRPTILAHPGGIREFIASGLRFKAVSCGEYISLLVQDSGGRVVFRGAMDVKMWPKLRDGLENMVGVICDN